MVKLDTGIQVLTKSVQTFATTCTYLLGSKDFIAYTQFCVDLFTYLDVSYKYYIISQGIDSILS